MFQDNRCLQLDGRFACAKSTCRGHLRQLDTPLIEKPQLPCWQTRIKSTLLGSGIKTRECLGTIKVEETYNQPE